MDRSCLQPRVYMDELNFDDFVNNQGLIMRNRQFTILILDFIIHCAMTICLCS